MGKRWEGFIIDHVFGCPPGVPDEATIHLIRSVCSSMVSLCSVHGPPHSGIQGVGVPSSNPSWQYGCYYDELISLLQGFTKTSPWETCREAEFPTVTPPTGVNIPSACMLHIQHEHTFYTWIHAGTQVFIPFSFSLSFLFSYPVYVCGQFADGKTEVWRNKEPLGVYIIL